MGHLEETCKAWMRDGLILKILFNEAKHRVLSVNENGSLVFDFSFIDYGLVGDIIENHYSPENPVDETKFNYLLDLYSKIKIIQKEQDQFYI